MTLQDCQYYDEDGSIGGTTWILYDADSIEHLPVKARRRLAELHNEQPEIDYEAAEAVLITEGLYDPNDLAQ